jgi:hypothetical protein
MLSGSTLPRIMACKVFRAQSETISVCTFKVGLGGKEGYNGSSQKGKKTMETTTQGLEEVTATPASAAKLIREVRARTPLPTRNLLEINRNSRLLRRHYSL